MPASVAQILDLMEYANDAAAQAAFVTNAAAGSQYPPAYNDTYVKSTSHYSSYTADKTANPASSLTGNYNNGWVSDYLTLTNQRFHIDLGSAKIITKVYYENQHDSGTHTGYGAKNFTLWGSNTAGDFADLAYANDGTWVPLTCDISQLVQHVAADQADPHYINVTNTTAYRYYAFKFADTWAASDFLGVRRIELQSDAALQDYSEATIKQEGSYSLRGVALATGSLNKTLTRAVSPVINLTDKTIIKFDMRASRTGSNIKIGIRDSGGTVTEITPAIAAADTWQTVVRDLSYQLLLDPSLIALWRFESGALVNDSKGGNTLTASANPPTADTADFKEGAACALFVAADSQRYSIADASLDAGFPFKNGDTTKIGSFCFWYKPTSTAAWRFLISKSKWTGSVGNAAFALIDHNGTLYIEYGQGGTSWNDTSTGITLTSGHWYHIACTITAAGVVSINVWDATTSTSYAYTNSFGAAPYISNNDFVIGDRMGSNTSFDARLDELMTFNRILDISEITAIRNKTYSDIITNRDAINSIIITIVDAAADNTFYIDNMFADVIQNYLIHRGRDRFRTVGYSLGN